MGTLTYLGTETVDVPLLRRSVKPGDVIDDVDDELLTIPDLVWPAATWLVNGDPHEHDLNATPTEPPAPAAEPAPEPAHAATEEN